MTMSPTYDVSINVFRELFRQFTVLVVILLLLDALIAHIPGGAVLSHTWFKVEPVVALLRIAHGLYGDRSRRRLDIRARAAPTERRRALRGKTQWLLPQSRAKWPSRFDNLEKARTCDQQRLSQLV